MYGCVKMIALKRNLCIILTHNYVLQSQEYLLALKRLLKDVVQYLSTKKPKILISEMHTAYRVVCDPLPVGLTMRKMSAEENKLYSVCPLQEQDVSCLQTDLCGQVDEMD